MTGFVVKLAGMLVGVVVLTQLARWLGLGGQERIQNAEHARTLAEQASPGFFGGAVAVDESGTAALIEGQNSSLMLIRTKGPRFISRILNGTTRTSVEAGQLTICIDEPDFPPASLTLGSEAPHWAALVECRTHG